MKKNYAIISLMLLLTMLTGPMLESMQAKDKFAIDVRVHLEWGRRSKDCRGFGICIFIESIDFSGDLLARYAPNTEILQLEVPYDLAKQAGDQFDNDVFIMEEDLELPEEISKQLGSEHALLIKSGKYEMKHGEKGFLINFPQ